MRLSESKSDASVGVKMHRVSSNLYKNTNNICKLSVCRTVVENMGRNRLTRSCNICGFVASKRSNLIRHKKRKDHYTELEKPKIKLVYPIYRHLIPDDVKNCRLVPMDLETYFGKFSSCVKSCSRV